MPGTVRDIFVRAQRRWPRIGWAYETFEAHAGDAPTAHGEDLYLGGAAGHRIDAAWEVAQSELGPYVQRVLSRQPLADCTVEDLWGDTLMRLMEDDDNTPVLVSGRKPARIVRYRGLVSLANYFILVAKRLAIQRHRRRREELRLDETGPDDDRSQEHADPRTPAADDQVATRELDEAIARALTAAYQGLGPEDRFLIVMVYRQGMKQKDVGKLLEWSEFKTSRRLSAVMESMRESLEKAAGGQWAGMTPDAWEQAWQGCWAQEGPSPATSAQKFS